MADSKVEKLAPGAKGKDGKEICRAFRNNGKCRFADQCKYEHSGGTPIDAPPRDYTPKGDCHNWTDNKKCRFGERCRFLHGAGDKRTTYRVAKRENNQEVCRNFQNRGKCRFGDNCKHKHVKSDKTPAPKAASGGAGRGDGAGRPRRRRRAPRGAAGGGDKKEAKQAQFDKDGVEVCRQNLKGKCKFGTDCSYSHAAAVAGSGSAGGAAPKKPREPRPPKDCTEFAEGKCEYGDDCRFKHGANDKRDLNAVRAKRRAAGNAAKAGTA
jgi:hypothetical protein